MPNSLSQGLFGTDLFGIAQCHPRDFCSNFGARMGIQVLRPPQLSSFVCRSNNHLFIPSASFNRVNISSRDKFTHSNISTSYKPLSPHLEFTDAKLLNLSFAYFSTYCSSGPNCYPLLGFSHIQLTPLLQTWIPQYSHLLQWQDSALGMADSLKEWDRHHQ